MGRTRSNAAQLYVRSGQGCYAISITFLGSGRELGTFDFSQTFARHRPINGATTIEPNATANATCILLSLFPWTVMVPGSLAQMELILLRYLLWHPPLSCVVAGQEESHDTLQPTRSVWEMRSGAGRREARRFARMGRMSYAAAVDQLYALGRSWRTGADHAAQEVRSGPHADAGGVAG